MTLTPGFRPPPALAGGAAVVGPTRALGGRPVVRPGALRLNVTNRGEDVHDLVVLDRRGRRMAGSGEIGAGARATIRITLLRAGTYRLLCTRNDHAARGMRARLRVR